MSRPMKVRLFMDAKPSTIGEQINAWVDYVGSATIVKTETVVTSIAEKHTDETCPCIVVTICMSRSNQIRILPRVVSGVALPYSPPQPRPP
jgi:hypothetical protein